MPAVRYVPVMDRKLALVIGASGGIGSAPAAALDADHTVTRLSRSRDGMDVTDESSVCAALDALEGPYDLIFVATGALSIGGNGPEKSLKSVGLDGLSSQFAVNAVGPMLVLKHGLRLLPRDRRSVFAALSARVGSIGDNKTGGWYGYRASKAALNQLIHGAAVEVARTHPKAILALLHPGTVDTEFTRNHPGRDKLSPSDSATRLISVLDGLVADQSGGFFDYSGDRVPW